MSAPKPYYETPAGAPCKVRLFLGDCRKILPLVAPPTRRVVLIADPPYGQAKDSAARAHSGTIMQRGHVRALAKAKAHKPIAGDDATPDIAHLAAYERRLVWGFHAFSPQLPASRALVVWDKREGLGPDDGADAEIAWTSFGGAVRVFGHFWKGALRRSEKETAPHLHPTQKPEAFYRWLFSGRGRGKPVVKAGDIIVSPYCGSDPEARVAIEFGLDHVGIDVEREHLDTVIKYRIEPALAAARQAPLPGADLRAWLDRADVGRNAQLPLFGDGK
jgi:hypothetical protein